MRSVGPDNRACKYGSTMRARRWDKCRLCLRLAPAGRLASLFEQDEQVSLADMVAALTRLQVGAGDGLPDRICDLCVEHLSSAYVFKLQCEHSDTQLRKFADTKYSSAIPSSYSGLLQQDLHVRSQLDCSDFKEHIDNNININKDQEIPHNSNSLKPSEPTSDSEPDRKSMKCVYCHELHNSENGHDCGGTTSSEQTDGQTSDSDETLVADECVQNAPNINLSYSVIGKGNKNNVACLLCDDIYNSFEKYSVHIEQCTANVKLRYFVCSTCHEVTTDKPSHLQHVKERHFTEALSIDCVDSLRAEEQMQKAGQSPLRREVGWSVEDLYATIEPRSARESSIPSMVKSFLGLHGTESSPKQISPARESFRKLIRAGREKTYNYYCAMGKNKKLKKKAKPRSAYARKNVERQLFTNDQNFNKEDKLDESFSTISEASVDSVQVKSNPMLENKKVFMLSDFLQDRESITQMLTELGATVAVDTRMEMQATHFVSNLSRDTCSGMMVCALATGKWLLRESYVADSYRASQLLDERKYEWADYSKLCQLNSLSEDAALAGSYWRHRLQASPAAFPFRGARVVLIMERKYFKYYRLVLKTLKAKVLSYDQRNPDHCRRATHCFVDMKSIESCDVMFFANNNVPVFPYQYILIYLLNRGCVNDEHKYLLQDYKSLKTSMSRRLNQTM